MEDVVCRKRDKKVRVGWVTGPFPVPPPNNFQVSPFGVVPKKKTGEYRMIHHLSFLRGALLMTEYPTHTYVQCGTPLWMKRYASSEDVGRTH